jgi:hypothetical protein
MFEARRSFMTALESKRPGSYPPDGDLASPEFQRVVRDITLRGVEEVFEALQHLKGWKTHRAPTSDEVNREAFLEEVVDAINYFLALVIMTGIDADEFLESFYRKDGIIRDRLGELA